jgi:hypothetical protein
VVAVAARLIVVAARFIVVAARFIVVAARFIVVAARFIAVAARFIAVAARFIAVAARFIVAAARFVAAVLRPCGRSDLGCDGRITALWLEAWHSGRSLPPLRWRRLRQHLRLASAGTGRIRPWRAVTGITAAERRKDRGA